MTVDEFASPPAYIMLNTAPERSFVICNVVEHEAVPCHACKGHVGIASPRAPAGTVCLGASATAVQASCGSSCHGVLTSA